ncbi:Golgi resident protein GCP60-like isoform X2 [Littorina saxatilis]|uniref:Golgi resident protein GCP60 n=1 Tax=Littorina saxatilis TaxID=31220 RepID=A0AAN9GD71_9CAEN
MAAAESLANGIKDLQVNDEQSNNLTYQEQSDAFVQLWGFALDDLYKIALKFFKEKEGKALQLSYQDKLRLVAYTKQVSHGKYTAEAMPDVGFLDVVGNDRSCDPGDWQAWQVLGDMSKEKAMTEFVEQLDAKSSLFKPYVKAHKAEQEEMQRKTQEAEDAKKKEEEDKLQRLAEEEALRRQEIDKQRQHDQEMQIRAALNQQTAAQFKQYVQQQYPYNPQLQDALIEHLQEQHYQQYMQQVYQQQILHQQQQFQQLQKMQKDGTPPSDSGHNTAVSTVLPPILPNGINGAGDSSTPEEGDDANDDLPPIAAASMWTRKDLKEFKDSLRKDKDSVIKIGSGETVTVRVPTHEDGTCLFWEFATDHYDIGFGVYFEWTIAPSNTVSVHVSESSDEEEFEEERPGVEAEAKGDDVERGGKTAPSDKPPTDEIIPVYRRDCHEEVYCGSHVYPGRGVYLLKFDNSYSLWRSKTLYYRVYYSR